VLRPDIALVVDGAMAGQLLGNPRMAVKFRRCAMACGSVLFCRLSPMMKARIVTLLRSPQAIVGDDLAVEVTDKERLVTLAIGDGANDVSMIREADVGVGLYGREGRQAALSGDFAVARFRFLLRLMLVHGRWSYRRLCVMVLYFFYKNLVFIPAEFFFIFWSGYSAQTVYDALYLMMFNTIFTSLPVLLYGLFDQDFAADSLMAYPALYMSVLRRNHLGAKQIGLWLGCSAWHALVCFFVPFGAWGAGAPLSVDGRAYGLWEFGTVVYTAVFVVVTVRLLMVSRSLSTPIWIGIGLSVLAYFVVLLVYGVLTVDLLNGLSLYRVFEQILTLGSAWFAVLLSVVLALLPDVVLLAYANLREHLWSEARKSVASGVGEDVVEARKVRNGRRRTPSVLDTAMSALRSTTGKSTDGTPLLSS
jgi:magnesium-transporting ATPase (P-type)